MNKNITILKGDGIGPEIVDQALIVLDKIQTTYHHTFEYTYACIGGAAIDACGECLPQATIDACLASDSVLLGAVGGPAYDNQPPENRPEKALLGIRSIMGLYSNIRPATLIPALSDASPLKQSIIDKGIDFVVVRELTGGVYFGQHISEVKEGVRVARDVMEYADYEIERIARVAFQSAMHRNKKLCSVDKANVLDSSKLWRSVVNEVANDFPEVEVTHMYVDNAAMQLCKDPSQFDVIVTENMFGDILSDEASMITGTIGTIPSSSLGDTLRGMYEPIHGSAPDIASKDLANPIGTILSAAMMLRYSFLMEDEAQAMEDAVNEVLNQGYRTSDMMSDGCIQVGCKEMGQKISEAIK